MKKKTADGAVRVTEVEALMFAKMDSDIRFHMVSARNAELELAELHRLYLVKKGELENAKLSAQKQVQLLQPQYVEFARGLASKYKVDPQKMVIDTDSKVIREP
jgi:hypothetical protein